MEIEKRNNDQYFIIYEINKAIYSYNGSPEDIINDLLKSTEQIKANDE